MDESLEHLINGPAGSHPFLDGLMKAAAAGGEPLFIALVVVWFLVGWLRRDRKERHGAIAAVLAAAVALAVNLVISHIWARPRPFVADPLGVHLLVSHGTDASFPSDHEAAGFAIATVLFARHRIPGVAALAFAALMGYARVYVGDHYPLDVLAGAIIGLIAGTLLVTRLRFLPDLATQLADRIMGDLHLLPAQARR